MFHTVVFLNGRVEDQGYIVAGIALARGAREWDHRDDHMDD